MREKRNYKIRVSTVIAAALMSVVIGVVYIVQLNKTISGNIIQNIGELAAHDQSNIANNIEVTWKNLEYISGKFISYRCNTIEEIEALMNLERANSMFSHIYMVGEDGKVYTDKFLTYDPASGGQNGRVDLLPYFADGEQYVVARYDDKVAEAGLTKESILYGIRLNNFIVDGIRMVALVGISDINNIQDRLRINSFTKGGVSRGYSAVIDMNGDYIVNIERMVYLNHNENFFSRIDNSRSSDLSSQEIAKRMTAEETFSFYHTNAEGVERLVYCMPFEENGIHWYFLSSVESTVFTEQNRLFLAMSMAMLTGIVVVVIVVMIFVMESQHKVITANAEATASATFLANMSHEIRTPLNGIIGLIFLMEKDIDGEQNKNVVKQRLSKAKDTAEYLLSLINNILDISKLEMGKVTLNRDIISPELIINAIWSMQKNNIENRGIRFVVEKTITVPWMIGDDIVIKQILMNILGNAAKFTPEGGKITLSVVQEKRDEHHVDTVFTCTDTGCGMSEDFLGHIWDSFSQERNKNEDSMKGTGLGMAISKLLVDAMGGEITVESRLGEGSTFCVILHSEIADEEPEYLAAAKKMAEQSADHNKSAKILVAEDNELNAEILIEILESEGFDVIYAQNGQIAVDKFRDSKAGEISVILMDMQMPVMDGCEAAVEIRKMNRADAKNISIIACTANSFNEDRERAEASGMSDFLSKPIDVGELLKKLGGSTVAC